MRLLITVRAAQITPARTAIHIAVLYVIHSHLHGAGDEVHSEKRFCTHKATPIDEVVGAELIRFRGIPRAIENRGAFVFRTDTVQPVVSRHEVAAGIAHNRHTETFDFCNDVCTKTILV